MEAFSQHEILVGTYEEFVLGYKVVPTLKDEENCELVQSFTVKAHCGPVRSLATGSKYVISGGSDEMCKVFDMNSRTEHGVLMHHEGTVTCLATHPPSHLLTAGDDNTLAVLRMGSWQVEKTLYKHSAGITAMAIHPTGKLAFTAGKDKKLITWNLVKARPAFISNIKGIAEFLVVSPDGTRYAVGLHRRVDVYSIENAGVEYTIDLKARPNCLVFLNNDTVVVGGESKSVQIHSLIEKCLIKDWEAHQTRVRCMLLLSEQKLITASSCDGCIKVWNISGDRVSPVTLVSSVDTQCRITCMAVWHPGLRPVVGKKRKKKTVENLGGSEKKAEEASSPKKKVKLSVEPKSSVEPQTLEVVHEISVKKDKPKFKKKKAKSAAADTGLTTNPESEVG